MSALVTDRRAQTISVERLPARVLFWGALLGVVLMVLGTGVYALGPEGRPDLVGVRSGPESGHAAPPGVVFRSVGETWRALVHWPPDPAGVAAAGILVVLATPVAAVAVAVAAFVRAGDARFAAIGLLVGGWR
jgi:hypothetical protein